MVRRMKGSGKKSMVVTMALSLFFLAVSCGKPDSPVPAETMGQLMYEMYVIDEYLYSNGEIRAQSDSEYVYLPILEKYGLSVDDFNNALDYYLRHIEELKEISSSVTDRLKAEKAELDSAGASKPANVKAIKEQPAEADSSKSTKQSKRLGKRKLDKEKFKKLEERFDENSK